MESPRTLYGTDILWTGRDEPELRDRAVALGYGGGSAMSFVRVADPWCPAFVDLGNLEGAEAIASEEELGRFAAKRLPHWKLEGYCEYAAVRGAVQRDKLDSLESRYSRYLSLKRLGPGPTRLGYVRGQLLVEYLMAVEGWGFGRLMSDQTDEEEAHRQLLELWAKRHINPES